MGKPLLSRILIALFVVGALGALAAVFYWYWYEYRAPADVHVVLYGNVDFRQASLAFQPNERIAEVLVEEGDLVRQHEVLARLETDRLAPQVAEAEALVAAQQAVVERLENGTRPEEIVQARANEAAARAEAVNARRQYERQQQLIQSSATSQEQLELARAASATADALVEVRRAALALALAGPRAEEIAEARAQLNRSRAQLELAREQLRDAELRAPFDGIVRSRLMEPGEVASPTRPVISLARVGVKWIRAYVDEPDLGRVKPGMKATIVTDTFPDRPLKGWVGFISPVAEFTPRNVQTEELRTNLVYEVRVFVEDPDNTLRLGMPVTVRLLSESNRDENGSTSPFLRDGQAQRAEDDPTDGGQNEASSDREVDREADEVQP